jgi:colanic acid/amylovoran biosynthesis glycosyltransferase
MLIYVFVEHYPNPYKPWIDTQIVELLRAGHDVRVLAEAAYRTNISDEVRRFNLEARSGYYPTTLSSLMQHSGPIVGRFFASPIESARRALRATRSSPGLSAKQKLLSASRSVVMPATEPDVCYIHNLVTAARLTFLKAIYPRTRICLYFHGGEVGGQPKVKQDRAIFASVDTVITGTRFAAGQGVDRGCAPDKIAIVPLGFNLADYVPEEPRRYRQDGSLRLVSVGRMSPEKGFLHALSAIRQLVEAGERRVHYRLVGSGIQMQALQAYVRDAQLESYVTFAGEKTRTDVALELARADALVLPSIVTDTWAETQAAVVQEALLMGCLTITTTAGGVPESNAEAMKRFDVAPADPDAIAARIRDLVSLTPDEWQTLGRAGRAFAADKYGIGPLMARILAHATGTLPQDDPARYVRGMGGGRR